VPQPAVSNRSKEASLFDHLVGAGAVNIRSAATTILFPPSQTAAMQVVMQDCP